MEVDSYHIAVKIHGIFQGASPLSTEVGARRRRRRPALRSVDLHLGCWATSIA